MSETQLKAGDRVQRKATRAVTLFPAQLSPDTTVGTVTSVVFDYDILLPSGGTYEAFVRWDSEDQPQEWMDVALLNKVEQFEGDCQCGKVKTNQPDHSHWCDALRTFYRVVS